MPNEKSCENKLTKDGELRVANTRCDLCGSSADVILPGGKARCSEHLPSGKKASAGGTLKNAGDELSNLHKA